MHTMTVLPAALAPAPTTPSRTVLTERGYAVLALIHEQDALDLADVAGRDRLDREISELLDSDGD